MVNLVLSSLTLCDPAPVSSGAFSFPFGSGTITLGVGDLTSVGTTATVAMSDTSTLVDGGIVTVSGATQTEYNGDYTITNIVGNTSFDYIFAGSSTSPATGTIVINFGITQTQIDALAGNSQFLFDPGTAFAGYPFAGSFRSAVLQCVFRKVTPANVTLVFD